MTCKSILVQADASPAAPARFRLAARLAGLQFRRAPDRMCAERDLALSPAGCAGLVPEKAQGFGSAGGIGVRGAVGGHRLALGNTAVMTKCTASH